MEAGIGLLNVGWQIFDLTYTIRRRRATLQILNDPRGTRTLDLRRDRAAL